jgi:hypothetical protein
MHASEHTSKLSKVGRAGQGPRRERYANRETASIFAIVIPGIVNAGAISRIPLTETAQTTQYLLAGQWSGGVGTGRAVAGGDSRRLRHGRRHAAQRAIL